MDYRAVAAKRIVPSELQRGAVATSRAVYADLGAALSVTHHPLKRTLEETFAATAANNDDSGDDTEDIEDIEDIDQDDALSLGADV